MSDAPTFDLKELSKHIDELTKENARYGALKERYVEHAKQARDLVDDLKDIADKLSTLASEIDPVITTSKRGKRRSYDDKVRELYERMNAGLSVTTKKVMSVYSLPYHSALYIIKKLQTMDRVEQRKNGVELELYVNVQ